MRMMQSECENNFTEEVPKGDSAGEKDVCKDVSIHEGKSIQLIGEAGIRFTGEKIHEGRDYPLHLGETNRLPIVSLVTIFKVNKRDITNYQPGDN